MWAWAQPVIVFALDGAASPGRRTRLERGVDLQRNRNAR